MRLELILSDEELQNLHYALKDAVTYTEEQTARLTICSAVYGHHVEEKRKSYVKLLDKIILASNEYEKQKKGR